MDIIQGSTSVSIKGKIKTSILPDILIVSLKPDSSEDYGTNYESEEKASLEFQIQTKKTQHKWSFCDRRLSCDGGAEVTCYISEEKVHSFGTNEEDCHSKDH